MSLNTGTRTLATIVDSDQTAHKQSDQGLHCLPVKSKFYDTSQDIKVCMGTLPKFPSILTEGTTFSTSCLLLKKTKPFQFGFCS